MGWSISALRSLRVTMLAEFFESIDDFGFDLPKYRAFSLLVTLRDGGRRE
jgi:hypothetical protein